MNPDGLESLGEIIARLMSASRMGEQLDQARIWEKWDALAGPRLCRHGSPYRFKDRRLYVRVDSPVWMHRFTYEKAAIMRRINREMGYKLVTDLFFHLEPDQGPPPSQDVGYR